MSRILRTLVCLLLICSILVNLSPLNADASAAGAVLGITKAASVSVPALWPIVAALAVVGITAYGVESGAFETLANRCYSALESAGSFIHDGMIDILRTENNVGEISYYLPGDLLSSITSMSFYSEVREAVYVGAVATGYPFTCMGVTYTFTAPVQVYQTYSGSSGNYYYVNLFYSSVPFAVYQNNGTSTSQSSASQYGSVYISQLKSSSFSVAPSGIPAFDYYASRSYCQQHVLPSDSSLFESLSGLNTGYMTDRDTVLDDETIVSFHPYLAEVLRTRTGGSGGSGEDDNKWWLAVAYAETLDKLYQTTQQAQIENPSVVEIPDLQEGTQYEVSVEEDEDGNKKYILNPIYNPGSNPGTGTDPGTDPDLDPDPDPDTGSGDNTGTDSGNSGNTGSTWKPPSDPTHFKLVDLSKFFPFCIPFDLFDFFKLLNADPVAPSFTWEIQDLSGQTYGLTVDLSQWDSVAQLFRRLQLFLFVCGLAAASRKYIKW